HRSDRVVGTDVLQRADVQAVAAELADLAGQARHVARAAGQLLDRAGQGRAAQLQLDIGQLVAPALRTTVSVDLVGRRGDRADGRSGRADLGGGRVGRVDRGVALRRSVLLAQPARAGFRDGPRRAVRATAVARLGVLVDGAHLDDAAARQLDAVGQVQ